MRLSVSSITFVQKIKLLNEEITKADDICTLAKEPCMTMHEDDIT